MSNVRPASYEIWNPPSSPSRIRFGFVGSIHIAWWSPCVAAPIRAKLRPPSSDL
jgi:hypothetical protein